MNRLEQFWNFGHNCAVLGYSPQQVENILIDNRFNSWALSEVEKSHFQKGYYERPLQWGRQNLRSIDVRPIVHETSPNLLYELERKPRGRREISPETIENIKKGVTKFWNSERGFALRATFKRERELKK